MLRFFPYVNGKPPNGAEHWRFTVMPYGLVCVTSMAGFCIKYTARKNYAKVPPETGQRVERDFYVDDFITSVDSIAKAKSIIADATKLLATTGFVLTKFSSNCRDVLEDVEIDSLTAKQKVLGLSWNAESDRIIFRNKSLQASKFALTRRTALSYLNSYFDPLGLWCPYFVKLKLCYSTVVANNSGWDDEVSDEVRKKWNQTVEEVQGLTSLSFPQGGIRTEMEKVRITPFQRLI